MKKINVFLVPNKHPVYRDIVINPPDKIHYININKDIPTTHYSISLKYTLIKKIGSFIINYFKIPRIIYVYSPKDTDVIHGTAGTLV